MKGIRVVVAAIVVGLVAIGAAGAQAHGATSSAAPAAAEAADSSQAAAKNRPQKRKRPDLVIVDVMPSKMELTAGEQMTVATLTRNRGRKSAAASVTGIYLTKKNDEDPNKKKDPRLGGGKISKLPAKAQQTRNIVVRVPAKYPAGGYYLWACADDKKEVRESREDNNCKVSPKIKFKKKAKEKSYDLILEGPFTFYEEHSQTESWMNHDHHFTANMQKVRVGREAESGNWSLIASAGTISGSGHGETDGFFCEESLTHTDSINGPVALGLDPRGFDFYDRSDNAKTRMLAYGDGPARWTRETQGTCFGEPVSETSDHDLLMSVTCEGSKSVSPQGGLSVEFDYEEVFIFESGMAGGVVRQCQGELEQVYPPVPEPPEPPAP